MTNVLVGLVPPKPWGRVRRTRRERLSVSVQKRLRAGVEATIQESRAPGGHLPSSASCETLQGA